MGYSGAGQISIKSILSAGMVAVLMAFGGKWVHAQNVTNFDPDLDGSVTSLVVQADGKVLAGGFFTHIGTQPQQYDHLVRINSDGTPDSNFLNPQADGVVNALALQSDGKILVGGAFFHLGGGMSYADRDRIARLNPDGSLDSTFDPPEIFGMFNIGFITTIAVQSDGKVLIGGSISAVGTSSVANLARLNADGSLDVSFGNSGNPAANDVVNALAIQPDGKILVGGVFTQIAGGSRNRIARLNADGTLDSTFQDVGDTEGSVLAIALQADGKVVIGGAFDQINGQFQDFLARLNSDGTSDPSYINAQADLDVSALALQPDGKLLAGGSFDTINNTKSRQKIARFNPNGSLDISFPDLTANFNVNALAVGQDNRLFVGGGFTSIASQGRNHLAQLDNDAIFKDDFESN